MGRYRRWLHHQEMDQQLHTKLHHLEKELAHLQGQIRMDSSDNTISEENQLVIALMASMHTHTLPKVTFEAQPLPHSGNISALALSPLPSWEQPPERKRITVHLTQHTSANTDMQQEVLVPALPHDELALQAEDMQPPDLDAQSPTEPQRELPHWLQALIESSLDNNQGTGLLNSESLRSNRLFQRWLERWGQPSSPSTEEGETMKQQTIRKDQES